MFQDFFTTKKVYIQDQDYSCGPCCIINIFNLKGQICPKDEAELCRICQTNKADGTSPDGMLLGLKAVGLEVVEMKEKARLSDIHKHLDQGHYVIVNYMHLYAAEGHYGVIVKCDDYALYMVDSSYGMIRLDNKDFEKAWHDTDSGRQQFMIAVA